MNPSALDGLEIGTAVPVGNDVVEITNTYTAPADITFDCDEFIRILRKDGTSSATYPSSREIGVSINGTAATASETGDLIKDAKYAKYDFTTGEFVDIDKESRADYFALEANADGTLKITSHCYSFVKIEFNYKGTTYTQLVCTPGDVTGDGDMSREDSRIIRGYLIGDDDAYELIDRLHFTYEGTYDLLAIMADMRHQNVGDVEVTPEDARIIDDILFGIFE